MVKLTFSNAVIVPKYLLTPFASRIILFEKGIAAT